ncbi:LarC family nickel insertion protein [Candidatus Woesearchaeota archaeon]|nr:LarC family nickel insertion protein [Candidatus Woesearchaeota archaeon]
MNRNYLYINCQSGIAGDMFIAACIDLGVDIDYLQSELKKLKIDEFSIKAETINKKGIIAKYLKLTVNDTANERHLSDINNLIDKSSLSDAVKILAKRLFFNLASAEASVHITTIDKIHFHEVGAMDSIIDIIGSAICLQQLRILGIDEVYCSKIPLPSGTIHCNHGEISNPAPAALKLLEDFDMYKVPIKKEIITPTGAVILKTIVKEQKDFEVFEKEMKAKNIKMIKLGYGAGTMELEKPNVLKLILFSQ